MAAGASVHLYYQGSTVFVLWIVTTLREPFFSA